MNDGLKKEQILGIIEKKNGEKEQILSILMEIQKESGKNYVDKEWARIVADELGIPLTKVYDVLTFYAMFSTEPRGKYVIEVCNSAPCHVVNGSAVVQMFEEELGIKMGETTADGLFTLQYVPCFGACDIGPAVKIGEKVYGNLTKEKVTELLNSYREVSTCQK
ncbi:MAG: NAD(P)H-dependent oxidoreductase subunit E [Clostridia bacterium]|nr:NAD(P)H-dependent oxidoreductase subunit E [Clostridia bacterium]MDD4047875.1 NAD(P)H-dependent oxidoreductase subunit E [Clostridia bacterium]